VVLSSRLTLFIASEDGAWRPDLAPSSWQIDYNARAIEPVCGEFAILDACKPITYSPTGASQLEKQQGLDGGTSPITLRSYAARNSISARLFGRPTRVRPRSNSLPTWSAP
jgi:hypothetical protein